MLKILFSFTGLILIVLFVISAIATVFGVPLGIILFIVGSRTKNSTDRKKYMSWAKKSAFGSVAALIVISILWAVQTFITTFLGITP